MLSAVGAGASQRLSPFVAKPRAIGVHTSRPRIAQWSQQGQTALLARTVAAGAATLERGATTPSGSAPAAAGPVLVAVEVPDCRLAFGEGLRIVGAPAELGSWDAAAAPALEWREGDRWTAALPLPPGMHAFKLVVVRGDGSQQWEEGADRQLEVAAGVHALKATCQFGNTGSIDVESSSSDESADEADAAEPAAQADEPAALLVEEHKGGEDALLHAAEAEEGAPAAQDPATAHLQLAAAEAAALDSASHGAALNGASNGAAPAAKQAALSAAQADSVVALELEHPLPAEELAAAWHESRLDREAAVPPAAAEPAYTPPAPAASVKPAPASVTAPTPAPEAAPKPAAVAAATRPASASGSALALLLPVAAGAAYTAAVSLGALPAPTGFDFQLPALVLPAVELPAGACPTFWAACAGDSLVAAQQQATAAFAAWQAGAAADLAPLQAQTADVLAGGLAGLNAASADALAASADTLAAFQATGADVLTNVRDNTGSLAAAAQELGAAALAAAQAGSVSAASSLKTTLTSLNLLTPPRLP